MRFSMGSLELAYTRGRVSLIHLRIANLRLCRIVAVIVGFTYLVVHGDPKTASVLISALVAGIGPPASRPWITSMKTQDQE
jgi:hypothetical protein